jgi:O-methyltransferase involved in polyketide biosynthesis
MSTKQSIQLGRVAETLLVPLYARAVETRRKRPILRDAKAVEMVESIDWDFERMGQRWRMFACVGRTAMFDVWVADFLGRHPEGTVVEIGCGLNTRFERLDNGRIHWFDLDLPEAIELRRRFFTDSERRKMLASSVVDADWIETVRRSPGPYFLVAETVFIYLEESQVRTALAQIARGLPGARIAFDTGSRRAVERANRDHAHRGLAARFAWACGDPREIEGWDAGLRLVESRTMLDVPEPLRSRFSVWARIVFGLFRRLVPQLAKAYQFNLFEARPDA